MNVQSPPATNSSAGSPIQDLLGYPNNTSSAVGSPVTAAHAVLGTPGLFGGFDQASLTAPSETLTLSSSNQLNQALGLENSGLSMPIQDPAPAATAQPEVTANVDDKCRSKGKRKAEVLQDSNDLCIITASNSADSVVTYSNDQEGGDENELDQPCKKPRKG